MSKRQGVDISRVPDPFDAPAETPDIPVEDDGDSGVKAPPAPRETQEQEMARLRTENAALRDVKVTVQAPPAPAPAYQPPPQLTAEELQTQAEQLGFTDPKQVESIGKIAAHVAAPAYQETAKLRVELEAERRVNAAKAAARAEDPQFSKFEAHVDAFLDSVPVYEKSDPEKLKGHMERATFYARGKMGAAAPQSGRRQPIQPTPKGGPDGEEDTVREEGGLGKPLKGPETYQTPDGRLRLTVVPRVPEKIRAMHQHPDGNGGVQIDYREEWKGPVFQKDLPHGGDKGE